jgi:hypothetical protein
MSYDSYLARHRRYPVEVTCRKCAENDIETSWLDEYEEEYGQGWLNGQEECRVCGADGDDLSVSDTDPSDWDPRL